MLDKMIYLIDNLLVYPKNMLKNINKSGGLIFSQEVLLLLINKGMTRENAYALVQKNAMEVWENDLDFKNILLKDKSILKYLSENEIDELFDMNKIKKNIHTVFEKLNLK
jgi:adenylosuccinate lyase